MSKTIVAGCDLGLVNFGFSIIEVKGSKTRVLHSHMVKNRVQDLKANVLKQRLALYKEIKFYLVKYKPSKLVAERFLPRGRFGQNISECIAFMLSVLAELCQRLKIEFQPITAASWKNNFNRAVKPRQLVDLYKFLKPMPPHIIDSILQANYGINPTYSNWSIDYLKKAREQWQK